MLLLCARSPVESRATRARRRAATGRLVVRYRARCYAAQSSCRSSCCQITGGSTGDIQPPAPRACGATHRHQTLPYLRYRSPPGQITSSYHGQAGSTRRRSPPGPIVVTIRRSLTLSAIIRSTRAAGAPVRHGEYQATPRAAQSAQQPEPRPPVATEPAARDRRHPPRQSATAQAVSTTAT